MSQLDHEALLLSRLRTMRIIIGALAAGAVAVLIFVLVAPARPERNNPDANSLPVMLFVGLWMTVSEVVALAFIRPRLLQTGRGHIVRGTWPDEPPAPDDPVPRDDVSRLCGLYQVRMLVTAAFGESLAFFFAIAYWIEGNPISLVLAVLALGVVVWQFPTRDGLERWLDEQQELVRQERAAG